MTAPEPAGTKRDVATRAATEQAVAEQAAAEQAVAEQAPSGPAAAGPAALSAGPAWASRAGLVALLLGIAAVLGRAVLIGFDSPPTNSDEATMGLAALHIAAGREFPVYFYGQDYMGTLEAYLAAPVFAILGPSVPGLRAPLLLLYALFLFTMWRLTRRLYPDRWFATLVVAVLAAGSDRVLKNQLIAGGGYPEMNPAGALLMLLALNLSLGAVRHRLAAVAVWGVVAGAMVWIDVLLLPYLGCAGLVLVLLNRRELLGRAGLVVAGSALLGAAPMLVHALAGGRDPVSVLLGLSGGGGAASWLDRLHGGLLLGIPMGTGFCSPSHCASWQLWWAVAFPLLLAATGVAAVRTLRGSSGRADPAGAERARAAVRLALVAAAGLTLVAYTRSGAAGSTPVESARYLSCLAISTPVVLWPLWSAARRGAARRRAARPLALAVLAAVLVSLGVASVGAAGAVPAYRQAADDRRELISTLRRLDVHYVYSEYWTCNNITFATREEIVCAVLDADGRPGLDRYRSYRRLVEAAPAPAYVLPAGSPLNATLPGRTSGELRTVPVAGYLIHLPAAPTVS
ncbi:hypothetical protein O7627_11495 [Solwaraspora sp. WMMD1047]|uniref:hypothetical protein n=1 Tax=Solwaraspora sp. WMMD1047 TaxID=3016102 RepID=UPI002416F5A9|nr:hypothetical protein [Solwaraspora sp. WMMD1047]MDG4829926.1 hypothetical protein [Solwaraspora sp. WMMD1047]